MEIPYPSISELITQAKQFVLQGNEAMAGELASKVLEVDPENINALLIKAGVSDPQTSLALLNKVLEIDPQNPVAREAMTWVVKKIREISATAWQPERSEPKIPPPITTAKAHRSKKWAFIPLLLLFLAVSLYVLYSIGIFDSYLPGLDSRYKFDTLKQNLLAVYLPTTTFTPTQTNSPTLTKTLTSTVTSTKISTFTKTPTITPTITLTSTPTPTQASTSKNTLTPTVITTKTPTEVPVVQITYVATPTDEPDVAPEPTDSETLFEPTKPDSPWGTKWIDIDLSDQMLFAYEGDTVVGSFLVSTGLPATPTVTGQFHIYVKYYYDDMSGDDYFLPDVPYTMYFYEGYGIHGTYWHSNFGTPMSHGCVNMETSEAGWLFDWAYVGILVNIHN